MKFYISHYGDIHAIIDNEILDFETESKISYLKDDLISKENLDNEIFPLLKDGDFIISDTSEDYEGLGKCIELKNLGGRKIISGLHTFPARDIDGKTVQGFRIYTLKHPMVIKELRRITTGTSVYGISKTNLLKVHILIPPLPEQTAIAKILQTADNEIKILKQKMEKLKEQKKGLMQGLLTGKKRIKKL